MGTEVLRPQDIFYDSFQLSPPVFYRRKGYFPNQRPTNSGHKRPVTRSERSEQKKKTPPQLAQPQLQPPRRYSSADELQSQVDSSISGRVTILRRGQSLDAIDAARKKRDSNNTTKGGGDDVYAGSAFFVSPAPSSLPLPSFFSIKREGDEFDDSATRDLRRLLRLD